MSRWLAVVAVAALAEASSAMQRQKLLVCENRRESCMKMDGVKCGGCEVEKRLWEEAVDGEKETPQIEEVVVKKQEPREEPKQTFTKKNVNCGTLRMNYDKCRVELRDCVEQNRVEKMDVPATVAVGITSFTLGCLVMYLRSYKPSKKQHAVPASLQRCFDILTDEISSTSWELSCRCLLHTFMVLFSLSTIGGVVYIISDASHSASDTGLNYAIKWVMGDVVKHAYGVIYFLVGLVIILPALRIFYQGSVGLLFPDSLRKAVRDAKNGLRRSESRARENVLTPEDTTEISHEVRMHRNKLNMVFETAAGRPALPLDLGVNLAVGGLSIAQSQPVTTATAPTTPALPPAPLLSEAGG